MPSTFLIPSLLWYGFSPPVGPITPAAGTDPLAPGGWGGRPASDEDLATLVRTLDSTLVLLNLAGYQALELAVGVAAAARETPSDDLISLDTATMTYTRGTQRAWTPLGDPLAQVALWVEPRFAVGPVPNAGPTLSLAALAETYVPSAGIALEFAATGSGWLRFTWPAALVDWPFQLTERADRLRTDLSADLAGQAAAAGAPGNGAAPLCGLFGLYNRSTWRVPVPDDAIAGFGGLLEGVIHAKLDTFLPGETAPPPAYPISIGGRLVADVTEEQAAANLAELDKFAGALRVQIPELLLATPRYRSFADTSLRWFPDLSATQVLFYAQELGVLDFLSAIEEQVAAEFPAGERYGGYDLRRGDTDTGHVYDGHARPFAIGDPVPGAGERGYVAQLRHDLAELGFGPMFEYQAGEPRNRAFDLHLEWAIRELQLYARMPNLARVAAGRDPVFYADGLEQVPNPSPYAGPVCGVVNEETRVLIGQWLDGFLRCPVVIEGHSGPPDYTASYPDAATVPDNLWRADQIQADDPALRVYARDFTGHWPLLPESTEAGRHPEDRHVIGARSPLGAGGPWANAPMHVWAEWEVLPETLTGRSFAALSDAGRSTFRMVRTVSEVECVGYFDSFNAWDGAFFSTGPCHWTIGLPPKRATKDAELPAYLAYLKGLGGDASEAYEDAFGVYGCGVTKDWPGGTSGPASPCWFEDERKYIAWVTFEGEDGRPVEAPRAGGESGEWFRQWHWCVRFAMAARTNEAYRLHMWDYARLRLRDVLSTAWNTPLLLADGRQAAIGDLYTSERAVAILLRWHVNQPPDLLPLGPNSKLVLAYQNARTANPAGSADWARPSIWNDVNEAALCDALFALKPSVADDEFLNKSLTKVSEWPSWLDHNTAQWALPVEEVLPAPVFGGLANAQVNAGAQHVAALTIDWQGPVGALAATSSNHAVVRDNGIAIAAAPPNYTITLTTRPGNTGRTTITLVAESLDGRTTATFTLTAGNVAGAPPAPAGSSGLSKRRASFRLDTAGLPA